MEVHSRLVELAQGEGFPVSGGVDFAAALQSQLFQDHVRHFDEWLSRGYGGEMAYIGRGRDRRADPRILFPEVQSVFCVLLPYSGGPRSGSEGLSTPRFARYLGDPGEVEDYHTIMFRKQNSFCEKLSEELRRKEGENGVPLRWKVCVDTSAVLERTWAVLSGLGWVGKNSLLIHPKHGSFSFIGVVFLNRKLGRVPEPHPNFCGNCTRCLSGCPTGAIEPGGFLNSNRCISYLTLERRGEQLTDAKLKEQVGPWVAGCDICQEVCPFNLKRLRNETVGAVSRASIVEHWEKLLLEDQRVYSVRVKPTALSRVKPRQFKRNLALALSNVAADFELSELVHLLGTIQVARPSESEEGLNQAWLQLEMEFKRQISFRKEQLEPRPHL